jgi:hypothetical protein
MIIPTFASSKSSSSSRTPITNVPPALPIELQRHGISKLLENRIQKAKELAALEQMVEDYNAEWIARSSSKSEAFSKRRLICLPLDERFDPPMGQFSHGHVQTGDKMLVPENFRTAIGLAGAEVPYLFVVCRVDGVTKDRVTNISEDLAPKPLNEVVGGPINFSAPNNYCFLPWWMMRALGLQPRDVVDVKLTTTVPPGASAKLRPHTSDFAKDISNTQAVLETELRHYSSLTEGTAIAFDYNRKRYWFTVEELRAAPRNEKVPYVKVQDCNLSTDFLKAKDEVKKQQESRKRRQQQEEEDE